MTFISLKPFKGSPLLFTAMANILSLVFCVVWTFPDSSAYMLIRTLLTLCCQAKFSVFTSWPCDSFYPSQLLRRSSYGNSILEFFWKAFHDAYRPDLISDIYCQLSFKKKNHNMYFSITKFYMPD